MLVTVPNLCGPMGTMMRRHNYERFCGHQTFTPDDLADHCRQIGLRVVFSGLVGTACLPYLFNQEKHGFWASLGNAPVRWANHMIRGMSRIMKHPVKAGSLTRYAGCVAFKDD